MQLMASVRNSVEFSSAEKVELCNGSMEGQEKVNVGRHFCFVHVSIFLVQFPKTCSHKLHCRVAKTLCTKKKDENPQWVPYNYEKWKIDIYYTSTCVYFILLFYDDFEDMSSATEFEPTSKIQILINLWNIVEFFLSF